MVLFICVVVIIGFYYFLNYELYISLNLNDLNKVKVDCVLFWRLLKIIRVVCIFGFDLWWVSRENYYDV